MLSFFFEWFTIIGYVEKNKNACEHILKAQRICLQ